MKRLHDLVEKQAEKWRDLYSSPGDFEEFGQQEAFWAGAKAMYKIIKQRRRNERRRAKDTKVTNVR